MIPFWKTLISWIYPLNIEKVFSPISGELQVNLQYGNLVVDSPEANYSYGNLHIVFQESIHQLKLDKTKNYKVLILGFGAGSIANILINENGLNCTITGIELDKEMIKLSKKYFFTNLQDQTNILNLDAKEFIEKNTETYDLVFVDLFIDTSIPDSFQSIHFLRKLEKSIKPKGTILMNSMTNSAILMKNWQANFGKLDVIEVQDNKVLRFKNYWLLN